MGSSQIVVREKHGEHLRLVSYALGSSEVWDQEWSRYSPEAVRFVKEYYRRFSNVYDTLVRYLPREGELLEAGSGLGHWVALLNEAGFRIRGMDCSEEALVRARRTFPDLSFERGDVRELPYSDASMSGYVSFGVAEHFREGPSVVLREAARVLRPGGILILTVPRVSPLRRIQPVEASQPEEGSFYQYFFEREELEGFVEGSGFRILAHSSYGTMKALRDVARAARRKWSASGREKTPAARSNGQPAGESSGRGDSTPEVSRGRRLFWSVQNLVFENPICRRLAGHMLLLVAERR
jgi:SAM-dependent methyltransferase